MNIAGRLRQIDRPHRDRERETERQRDRARDSVKWAKEEDRVQTEGRKGRCAK